MWLRSNAHLVDLPKGRYHAVRSFEKLGKAPILGDPTVIEGNGVTHLTYLAHPTARFVLGTDG
jgi:hypothetical protein